MTETIKLHRGPRFWMARFSDPAVQDAMGTDLVPTAWRSETDPAEVLNGIQTRNPACSVSLEEEPGA